MIGVVLRGKEDEPLALIIGLYIPPLGSPQLQQLEVQMLYAMVHDVIAQHAEVPVSGVSGFPVLEVCHLFSVCTRVVALSASVCFP
jgi:hypothetical protein